MTKITVKVNTRELARQLNDLDLLQYQFKPYELKEFIKVCEELIKKYGSSSGIELFITHNGNNMTYQEVVDLLNENEQLKQALREQLEENGNAYCIEILDKIFDLKYDEWQRKMNETHTYDYIDWENVLNDKGGVE